MFQRLYMYIKILRPNESGQQRLIITMRTHLQVLKEWPIFQGYGQESRRALSNGVFFYVWRDYAKRTMTLHVSQDLLLAYRFQDYRRLQDCPESSKVWTST